MFDQNPFWFVDEKPLTELLREEIRLVNQLFAQCPDIPSYFDLPEATASQRAACFEALAHRNLMGQIYDKFAGLYQESPSLGDEEKKAIALTTNLVAGDAPAWVLEINQMAELFPSRVFEALPKPLLRGGFYGRDEAENREIELAANQLSSIQEFQLLVGRVFNQQLQRLEGRWSAARPVTNVVKEIVIREQKPNRPKILRVPDKKRIARDKLIFQIEEASPSIHEYIKLMDERKAQPLLTWSGWPGSWSKAYKDPRLRKLIQQDKSRSLARAKLTTKR